jgi:putative nucleotidyltransferase with HDIG domain
MAAPIACTALTPFTNCWCVCWNNGIDQCRVWTRSPRFDAIDMAESGEILLISDWPERSQELAIRLAALGTCRVIGLDEPQGRTKPSIAVLLDIDFHRPAGIGHLRDLLSTPRRSATPIVAILRNDSHLQRVQAAALGAIAFIPAKGSLSEICAAIERIVQPAIAAGETNGDLTPVQNLEQAGMQFANVFRSAGCGEPVNRAAVESATDSVTAAINGGGIRQWLEVVWSYDDVTYQHCMMVTGLAAGFAKSLQFTEKDQKHLVRGALLHDVGKAKIPIAILNKPGRLTSEELTVMRTHAAIGYELLHAEKIYEPELLEVVLRHHELLDGSGYPDRLAGAQINDLVRLVTICDIYAALIERRPYKEPMPPARAFNILLEMGEKLEGALVRAFTQVAESSAAPAFA